ncbi:hypothetical protein D3C74_473010 [compost metagenome]
MLPAPTIPNFILAAPLYSALQDLHNRYRFFVFNRLLTAVYDHLINVIIYPGIVPLLRNDLFFMIVSLIIQIG